MKRELEDIEKSIRKCRATGTDQDYLKTLAIIMGYGSRGGCVYAFGEIGDNRPDGTPRFGYVDQGEEKVILAFTSEELAGQAKQVLVKKGIERDIIMVGLDEMFMSVHFFPELNGIYLNVGTPLGILIDRNIITDIISNNFKKAQNYKD